MGELVRSGQVAEVFAFYLGDRTKGELVIGGVDPAHYTGEFRVEPLLGRNSWKVYMENFGATSAIVDSGTSFLAGSTEVESLMGLLGAQQDPTTGLYLADCESEPTVTFWLKHNCEFSVEDLSVARNGSMCLLGFLALDQDPSYWVLQDIFLRKYYVKLDRCRGWLGIALAKAATVETTV